MNIIGTPSQNEHKQWIFGVRMQMTSQLQRFLVSPLGIVQNHDARATVAGESLKELTHGVFHASQSQVDANIVLFRYILLLLARGHKSRWSLVGRRRITALPYDAEKAPQLGRQARNHRNARNTNCLTNAHSYLVRRHGPLGFDLNDQIIEHGRVGRKRFVLFGLFAFVKRQLQGRLVLRPIKRRGNVTVKGERLGGGRDGSGGPIAFAKDNVTARLGHLFVTAGQGMRQGRFARPRLAGNAQDGV
mmetsp:Transcript_2198/g.6204  ORF Transcript_2198/g.6204 Transcript_2198/m.6204 type:complete len:246 (+) Transcript_2198:2433-3170(+)